MHYDDLTPYVYWPTVEKLLLLNVGWLELGKPYNNGVVDSEFTTKLRSFYNDRQQLTRGCHPCTLCLGQGDPAGWRVWFDHDAERNYPLGSAEI